MKASSVARYVLLPGIIPRTRALFMRGFGQVAFLMALIYGAFRLLPAGHPYLNPRNTGQFGIRHVVAAAANNIVVSWRNADQILIFILLLSAVVILILQIALVVTGFLFTHAQAGTTFTSFFVTPAPSATVGGGTPDIAFNLLDRVFGVPNLFCAGANSAICTQVSQVGVFPWPFHYALQDLFQFYSYGMLLIGTIIFLYFIFVTVAETAISGTPFGQRFQNLWVPIRLVVALGLLVPINYGLNSAQYIVLYTAKIGSSFATNTWNIFNNTVASGSSGSQVFPGGASGGANPMGERKSLVAKPQDPDVSGLVQHMSLIHGCNYLEWKTSPGGPTKTPGQIPANFMIRPYMVKNPAAGLGDQQRFLELTPTTTYADALTFFNNSDIVFRFGERSEEKFKDDVGNVSPVCGEIRIKVSDPVAERAGGASVGGVRDIQRFYFDLVKMMWFADPNDTGMAGRLKSLSYRIVEVRNELEGSDTWQCQVAFMAEGGIMPNPQLCQSDLPPIQARQNLINEFQARVNTTNLEAWRIYNEQGIDIAMRPEIMDRGWAGAGIWYNKIAQLNGAFANAVRQVPIGQNYPEIMKQTKEQNRANNNDISGDNAFNPNIANGKPITLKGSYAVEKASAYSELYKYWNAGGSNPANAGKKVSGDAVRDFINKYFGGRGLFSVFDVNRHVHPFAQLVSLGKSLIDAAIISIGASVVTGGLGGMAQVLMPGLGVPLDIMSKLLSSFAMVALVVGIVLFYILPFLPFLYFYFAVGTWVMSIFEAMVGVPLWALAHLRTDGDGLPGSAAVGGYFLIFEIFTRPILSVFGLIAAMVIFAAQVRILNGVWGLVTENLAGMPSNMAPMGQPQAPRDVIDQFFFTVIYTSIVYMCATSSFKLIDRIPDNILRYMGAGVSSFSDINEDPTGGLTRYATFGSQQIVQPVVGAVTGGAERAGGELGKIIKGAG